MRRVQQRLIDALRRRGERILAQDAGWVTMTRAERPHWYHVGPDGQLRVGFSAAEAHAVPWLARRLLAAPTGPSRAGGPARTAA